MHLHLSGYVSEHASAPGSKRDQIPWNQSYKQLWTAWCGGLRTEPMSSARTILSSLWAISPFPTSWFLYIFIFATEIFKKKGGDGLYLQSACKIRELSYNTFCYILTLDCSRVGSMRNSCGNQRAACRTGSLLSLSGSQGWNSRLVASAICRALSPA